MMIRIKSETAVITKTNASNGVNGDNINLNGKVLPAELADKGYKGAGFLNGEFVIAAAAGDAESRAATTVMNNLSQHMTAIRASRDDYKREIDAFLNDACRAVSLRGGRFDNFDTTILYVHDSKLIIANIGEALLFKYDVTGLTEVEFESGDKTSFGDICYREIEIKEKAQYIFLSSKIIDYLSEEDVIEAASDALSVKQAAQRIIDKATENGCELDATVFVTTLTPNVVSDAPLDAAAAPIGNDDYLNDDEELKSSKGKKVLAVILTIIILSLALLTAYLFASGKFSELFPQKPTETTSESTATTTLPVTSTTEVTTTQPTTSSPASTTEVTTTDAPSTTKKEEEATTRRTVTTTRREQPTEPNTTAEPTTEAPTTETPTTEAPTTEAPTEAPTTEAPTTELVYG